MRVIALLIYLAGGQPYAEAMWAPTPEKCLAAEPALKKMVEDAGYVFVKFECIQETI